MQSGRYWAEGEYGMVKYGLGIMAIIMIPTSNAAKHKNESNGYRNKAVEVLKQIGRYGCFALMIFNTPTRIGTFGLITR